MFTVAGSLLGRRLETTTESNLWWVGVLLDCVATLAGTGGKQLLRHASVTKKMRFYPLGLVFTAIIDPAFDIAAYSFAAVSIIAPMAGMVVVWNILLAPCTLGEQLTFSRKLGALLICIGTLCVGLFGNHNEVERTVEEYLTLFAEPAACAYYAAFVLWSIGCFVVWQRGTPVVSGFCVGAYAGSLAGNMFTTKAVVEMFVCVMSSNTDGEGGAAAAAGCKTNPFWTVWPYLFITISLTVCVISLYLLGLGLTKFEALFMITVYEGFMIITGSLSGNIVMREAAGQPQHILLLYGGAVLIILWGLWVLLRGETATDRPRARMLQDEEDQKWSSREGVAMVGTSPSDKGIRAAAGYDVPDSSENARLSLRVAQEYDSTAQEDAQHC
jgi:uncharacterized membrane protein